MELAVWPANRQSSTCYWLLHDFEWHLCESGVEILVCASLRMLRANRASYTHTHTHTYTHTDSTSLRMAIEVLCANRASNIYVCMHVCMYVYIYIYTTSLPMALAVLRANRASHTHTHTHEHTHTNTHIYIYCTSLYVACGQGTKSLCLHRFSWLSSRRLKAGTEQ